MSLVAGMVVTHSVRIRPGRYIIPHEDTIAIRVRGDNLVLDLRGVELIGDTDRAHPDRFRGIAIRIDSARNVTIRGVRARGFKVGILARHVDRLTLIDNDLSYNWKPRLYSGIEKESLIDWLDYHQNEHDEWLRYGAGIYLADVHGAEIRANTVRQGMDGLMLVRSDGARVWNNDFSYNSGIGVGLYRASHNRIMHNHIDYNVRGYSHGFYNRGQDSGGLLMYEQSDSNVVAYNSVTHSGDGLFLWAGQSTMDTGEGGANDNLFYHNDFSYAPTNGMEATFSRNVFVGNLVRSNWHGLWGGYSFNSLVLGNHFYDNTEAIAIEHGQDNRIAGNVFEGDTTAIHLWANPIEPSDWGYPKHRDTRSRDYTIENNTISGERVALRVNNTTQLGGSGNAMHSVDTVAVAKSDTAGWSFGVTHGNAPVAVIPPRYRVTRLPGGIDPLLKKTDRQGRATIIVDQWGPYDWQSPRLWPYGRDDAVPQTLRVIGPAGRWRVVSRDGVAAVSADTGKVGDAITVTPMPSRETDFSIELEYRGGAVTTPFGTRVPAGTPYRFSWSRFAPVIAWHVTFHPLDSARARVRDTVAVNRALGSPAVAALDTNRLDLTWYGPPRKAIPSENVLTEAVGTLQLPTGRYRLQTIADDAVRVYLDDQLVLDDWTPGESHEKDVIIALDDRPHRMRVVHLQLDGWYELTLGIGIGIGIKH